MRIAVVHNAVTDAGSPDERDVLDQAAAVRATLNQLGHAAVSLACTLDLSALKHQLREIQPALVFNLVESLDGQGCLIHLFPALLDALGIPYTGSKSAALYVTSNKILAKRQMLAAHLPTPPWIGPHPPDGPVVQQLQHATAPSSGEPLATRWIIKSLWEHASMGLDENELILVDHADGVHTLLPQRARHLGGACFAEAYIDGREFNVSLLAAPKGPQVLAPAEIIFERYPPDKPRIVGYRAKWQKQSYEYRHTPRCFDFAAHDAALLDTLAKLAQRSWQVFGLDGYGRVDFRIDAVGQPWILEINTNPCLSPDAGFAAAVAQSGLTFAAAVDRIVDAAFSRGERPC